MREHQKPAARKQRWPIWTALGCLPVYLLFMYFGYEDRGFAAIVFMVSLGVALAAHWNSRGHVQFWLAAVGLLVANLALVMLLPWPTWKLSGAAFIPIGWLDFFANFAVMRVIQTAINRHGREARAS